ncbi:MAG TPA: sugar phosphate nucleotidyltransferase [Candidatus Acidoferrum sp.]
MPTEKLTVHAVILAGGRGTRFWPRSRTRTPKQLLNIVGKDTMLQQTVARLKPLIPPERIWTVTNAEQAAAVRKQVPAAARKHVLIEPMGMNTAVAIGLAAIHLRDAARGDALMAVLPADHYIERPQEFREIVSAALDVAREAGRMVALGIPPTRPETGFGYIERAGEPIDSKGFPVFAVRRFTEKPELKLAQEYVASGNYHWNAGMFFWRVSTFLENLKSFLPKTHAALEKLSKFIGTQSYDRKLRAIYPKIENISVDYAVLEPATRAEGPPQVFVIPAEVGWSDIGSWSAVHGLLLDKNSADGNVFATPGYALDARDNLISCPGKIAALIGVHNLIVVDTPDALLICPRDRAQDVGKIVKWLEERRRKDLL